VLGARLLQEIIENREGLAHEIEEHISGPAAAWGVSVEGMLVKDIIFSAELQETLSSAAKAKRVGEAKIIQAKAEARSSQQPTPLTASSLVPHARAGSLCPHRWRLRG